MVTGAAIQGAGGLITCILPEGEGYALVEKLISEKGITTATLHHARGSGMTGKAKRAAFMTHIKKDVITAAVSAERKEEIFGFMFWEGNINRPHVGIIYMEKLDGFSSLVPFEEDKAPTEENKDK